MRRFSIMAATLVAAVGLMMCLAPPGRAVELEDLWVLKTSAISAADSDVDSLYVSQVDKGKLQPMQVPPERQVPLQAPVQAPAQAPSKAPSAEFESFAPATHLVSFAPATVRETIIVEEKRLAARPFYIIPGRARRIERRQERAQARAELAATRQALDTGPTVTVRQVVEAPAMPAMHSFQQSQPLYFTSQMAPQRFVVVEQSASGCAGGSCSSGGGGLFSRMFRGRSGCAGGSCN